MEMNQDFILDSMMNALNETNTLQNQAEASAIQFALGESDNMHDLLVAQTKANTALQYTVAVRDKLIEYNWNKKRYINFQSENNTS